jgi:poly(3-hydroxyalkanoate) synthetase
MKKQKFERCEVVIDTPVFRLLLFNTSIKITTPVVIGPPTAGRHPCVVQKLADRCVKQGVTTFVIELKEATHETRNTSIFDLVEIYHSCINFIGEEVDLIGVCQGGWLSTLYTSLYPETVKRLAIFSAPINTQTGQYNIIERYMKLPEIISFHKCIVAINHGIQKGSLQWIAFSMVDPFYNYYLQWIKLYSATWSGDKKAITKMTRDVSWNINYQDIAGNWILDCLDNFFKKNLLYKGGWKVGSKIANLKNIKCPVYLNIGKEDDITHPQQLFDIVNVISTMPWNIYKILFDNTGHTAAFTKDKNLNRFFNVFY